MAKKRLLGLDMLRIISMMGIIGLHVFNQGGLFSSVENTSLAHSALPRLIFIMCYASVNVFAMLTGYLSADKKQLKTYRLLDLLFTTFFYCAIITAALALFTDVFAGNKLTALYSLFPMLADKYWYLSCYILLFLLIPYINILISSISKRAFTVLLSLLFLTLSVLTTFAFNDFFVVKNGYSTLWLVFCYLVGAYVKEYGCMFAFLSKKKLLLIYLLVNFAVLVVNLTAVAVLDKNFAFLYKYNSPFIVISATLLLLLFSKINFSEEKHHALASVLKSLSASAFGVYIIHSHMMILDNVLNNAFLISSPNLWNTTGVALLSMTVIFTACATIDFARRLLFSIIRIDALLKRIASFFDKMLSFDNSVQ